MYSFFSTKNRSHADILYDNNLNYNFQLVLLFCLKNAGGFVLRNEPLVHV
jgi:hypothetical protein